MSSMLAQWGIQTLSQGGGVVLLALPASLRSVIFSFFFQNKGPAPPGPSSRSATVAELEFVNVGFCGERKTRLT